MLPLKLLSPEKFVIGDGRTFNRACRQHLEERNRQVTPGTPGSKSISSHTLRASGNEGDPLVNGQVRPCLCDKCKQREAEVNDKRKSEPFILATKLGNAGGVKEGQYGKLGSDGMVQTPSWVKP